MSLGASEIGAALAGAALVLSVTGAAASDVVPNDGRHDPAALDAAVLTHVNRARGAAGLPPLGPDPALRGAAGAHTRNMTRLGVFSHQTSAAGEETLGARMAGIPHRLAAENIISGYFMEYEAGRSYVTIDEAACRFEYADTRAPLTRQTYDRLAERLVARWMQSDGHRANILDPGLTRHGAALAPTGNDALCGEFYATQVFAG